jgi:hypothetical protein
MLAPGAPALNRDEALKVLEAVVMAAVSVRRIRPLTPILFVIAVALVVIGVVFFASSHPLRGGVLVVLAVASAVGALLSARYR